MRERLCCLPPEGTRITLNMSLKKKNLTTGILETEINIPHIKGSTIPMLSLFLIIPNFSSFKLQVPLFHLFGPNYHKINDLELF